MENAERSGYTPMGGDEMRHRFEMQSEYEEMASGLSLPIFVRDVSSSAFFEAGLKKLTKESLSDRFSLKDKSCPCFSFPGKSPAQVQQGS